MKATYAMRQGFEDLWNRLGAKEIPGPGFYFAWLEKQYSRPYRFHHTLEKHIMPALNEFSEVKGMVKSPEVVELAIWYHDAHDPRDKAHAAISASIAYDTCLSAGLQSIAERVRSLVLATKHHVKSADLASMLLGDCDYSILGRPRKEFEEYDENIRKEFSSVVPKAYWPKFEEGRRAFLQGLQSGVFLTPHFIEKYEAQARKNIEWAIRRTCLSLPSSLSQERIRLFNSPLPEAGLGLFDHWLEDERKDEGEDVGPFSHWDEDKKKDEGEDIGPFSHWLE